MSALTVPSFPHRPLDVRPLTDDQLFGVGDGGTADPAVGVASSVPAGADTALHADKDQLLVTLVELLHQQVHTLPEGGGEGGGSVGNGRGGGGTEQGDTKETTTIEEAVACSSVACKR